MKIFCKYHPKQPAYFSCPRCHIHFCNSCVVVRDKGGYAVGEKLHVCPSCSLPADWLGISNVVDPFWKRLHKFFVYPFGVFSLALMVVLAMGAALVEGEGLLSGLVMLLIWSVRIKYSFEALKTTARGDLRPPKITGDLIAKDFSPVFKQIILFALLGGASVLVAMTLGFFALIVFILFLVLLSPSMLILLVTTNSLFAAINPFLFIPLAFRIGWGYLLMFLFLILLNGAPTALFYAIIQYLPEQIHFFLFSIGETYYSIISYHLMGYVLLQYSEDIGYKVDLEDFRTGDAKTSEPIPVSAEDQMMAQVAPLIQEGRLDDAIEQIEIAVRGGRINAAGIRERYYKLIKTANRPEKLIEAGENYLEQLTQEQKMVKAAQVYQDCVNADASFCTDPEVMLKLGGWFNENGKPQEAIGVYNRLIKANPTSSFVARAYFHAAQTLHTGLRNTEKAKKILAAVLKKYPDDEIIPMARQFLNRLQSY